ncbi:MAG: transglutaminase-like domain-containing protein [Methanomassiliicoccus sp.]|nr:transglutaminase-like domain-containing protein [Methanomassiliicoccus sp.]
MERVKRRRPAARAAAMAGVVVIVILVLLIPAVQAFFVDLMTSPFRPRYPESATFTLERSLTVDANGGNIISYDFDICEPVSIVQNGYSIQNVSSVLYSPQVSFHEDRYGYNWVGWNGTSLSGRETTTCSATYQVTVRTHIWSIDRQSSLGIDQVPQGLRDRYLHDEWQATNGPLTAGGYMIDMTSPEVVSTAQAIVGNETNVYQVLKDIYDWMTTNVRYSAAASGGEPQTALETLVTRSGDCDDQSILFCSLARAAGVPAWLQMGALYVSADDSWGGHGWLQAYIPLASGGGENVTIDVVNKDFLVFRPNRFVDFTDDGVGTHLADYYYTFQTTYDRDSYAAGTPVFSEVYTKLSYEESSKKVSQGGVYLLNRDLMLPGTDRIRPHT